VWRLCCSDCADAEWAARSAFDVIAPVRQIDAAMGDQAWKIIGLLRLAPIVP
jgi:hypothetical protein